MRSRSAFSIVKNKSSQTNGAKANLIRWSVEGVEETIMAKQSDPIFVLIRMLGLPVLAGVGALMMCRPVGPDVVGNQFALAGMFLLLWAVLAFVQILKNHPDMAAPSKLPSWAQGLFLMLVVPLPGVFCYQMIWLQAPKVIVSLMVVGFAITAGCAIKSALSHGAFKSALSHGAFKSALSHGAFRPAIFRR
jgi:hypothetical protein